MLNVLEVHFFFVDLQRHAQQLHTSFSCNPFG